MLPLGSPDRIHVAFDDHRLVANAGLLLPVTLAHHLGLGELVDRHVDLGDAPGRANPGDKLLTLVASALAGGDCIDDADVLRTGRTASAIGCVVKAPSTLGTFLRSFRDVLQVSNAAEIESAKGQGNVGFLPTVEHLAIGNELNLVDVLYNAGIRLAGLTYSRKAYIGDGIFERNDGGLSEFGLEVVQRMNELGMVVDVSHASFRTAMDAIEASETPVTFSHDGSYTLSSDSFQARRLRKDEELLACARKGGVIGITAVPNRFSNDPEQSIECVLDHYDYMVNLVGIDHVAIGTDTGIGDSVGVGEVVMGRPGPTPARYMNGLESPADGKNIIRGLIARGYSDEDVRKIAGGNALALFRRVMG